MIPVGKWEKYEKKKKKGGCHTREKCIAYNARKLVLIADARKDSECLGTKWVKGVPLEVLEFAYVPTMKHIEKLGGKPELRMAKAKAGPVVTDSGNLIVDAVFGKIDSNRIHDLQRDLLAIPGVVETGLFVGIASYAYIGMPDGSVVARERKT